MANNDSPRTSGSAEVALRRLLELVASDVVGQLKRQQGDVVREGEQYAENPSEDSGNLNVFGPPHRKGVNRPVAAVVHERSEND